MRQLLVACLGTYLVTSAACGPKVAPAPPSFDEDLDGERATPVETSDAREAPAARPVAPHRGGGSRTGKIARERLVSVLDAGPPSFLRQVEVAARLDGKRFVGWELVRILDRAGPLAELDLAPGDVLLAVNGKPLSHPDQLHTLWDSLRTANQVTAQLWRGSAQLTLAFEIEPKL